MAEYLIQDTSLISIGDKVRVLSGMKDPMSLNTMRDKIEAASNEVITQSGLINQVKETLLEKINAGAIISTATITPTSNSTSINFTGVTDAPVYFCVTPIGNTALNRTTRYALNVVYDGNSTVGIYSTTTTATYTTNGYSWTYSNGTLNVKSASTSNGGYFKSGTSYQLTYVMLPSITTDATYSSSISPSSNSTSISFSGLTSEPKYFAIIPTSNTTLSSSTRYALNVVYDGNSTIGVYSNTSTATYTTDGFSWTYSNGTLTVKTASTSNGGYFRSGAEHKLIYVASKSGSGNGSVSIENNTEGLQDIIQLMDNMPSGAELNFEIVGGTTQPTSPEENTIWINTDVEITGWSFSATEPVAEAGKLWISTGINGVGAFNALKENDIQMYPLSAKQYINNQWIPVDAMTYQNGKWVLWITYLYNLGDECTDITGGWILNRGSSQTPHTEGTGSKNSTSISLTANDGKVKGVRTINMIDLTYASYLTINVTSQSTTERLLMFGASQNDRCNDGWAAYINISDGGILTLDVSGLTGKYYVGVTITSSYDCVASVTFNSVIMR